MQINISNIRFGDIDARHEILSRDPAKRRLFLNSFFVSDNFQLEDILSGEKFIIVGPKGSGKTAYLRYIQHRLGENKDSSSRFIIFRDDVTDQDREKLSTLANFRFYESNGHDSSDEQFLDCSSAWQLFIHREIAALISRSNDMCAKTPDVVTYINLLDKFFSNFKTSKFKDLLKRITKGRVKVGGFGNELELEAEFLDAHGNVDVSEFVRYCNSVVSRLDFNAEKSNPRFNIFFDEVNISFVSGAEFKKNAILIRDLISACGILNSLFAENNIPIYIYTALRSEVVDSVEGSVRELRKWIDDKAVSLNWMLPSVEYSAQPIITLLKKRIQANEIGADPNFCKEIDLNDYFDSRISGRPVSDFILFESWARPRDLVRLLGSAAKYVDKGKKFDTDSFYKARSEYSKGSWEEKRDELNSKYAQSEIDCIKKILTGYQSSFTSPQLEARIASLTRKDPRIKQFVTGRIIEVVLEDLFKVGILGNLIKSKKGATFPSFQYTGMSNFSSESIMCVHRSLWRELDLERDSGQLGDHFKNARKASRPIRQ